MYLYNHDSADLSEGDQSEDDQSEQDKGESKRSGGSLNSGSAFKIRAKYNDLKLRTTLYQVVTAISEDITPVQVDGDDQWDIQSLMLRTIDHRPLSSCRTAFERERLLVYVDTSRSCLEFAQLLSKIADILTGSDMCEVILAPNAQAEAIYDRSRDEFRYFYEFRAVTDHDLFSSLQI